MYVEGFKGGGVIGGEGFWVGEELVGVGEGGEGVLV